MYCYCLLLIDHPTVSQPTVQLHLNSDVKDASDSNNSNYLKEKLGS